MALISIARCLWFEETNLGATLNYRCSDEPEGVLFRVGISHDSLRDCDHALAGSSCLWTIKDGSLSVYGDSEELTLTFCTANGTLLEAGVSLYGEELTAFKTAINAFASRHATSLN